jgi:carboxyl-terminal processing protease
MSQHSTTLSWGKNNFLNAKNRQPHALAWGFFILNPIFASYRYYQSNLIMRTNFFKMLALLIVCQAGTAQTIDDTSKYKTLGLVWGFLKYHHPEVSKGKSDWDAKFIEMYDKMEAVETPSQINALYSSWISSLGKIPEKPGKITLPKNLFSENEDYRWFETSGFDASLIATLNSIKGCKYNAGHHYASTGSLTGVQDFSNEKGFEGFDISKKSHRLLNLFSFWNMTQYWNINKYMFDDDWLEILDESIAEFITADNAVAMDWAKAKLFARLKDSHTETMFKGLVETFSKKRPPFNIVNCNDTLVINMAYNMEWFTKEGLTLGDAITAIDGVPIKKLLKENPGRYMGAGNDSYLRSMYSSWLRYNQGDSARYEIVHRDGRKEIKVLQHFETFDFDKELQQLKGDPVKLPDNIGYLNLAKATKDELKEFFSGNKDKKGIILDLRNYPENFNQRNLTQYLLPEKKKFLSWMQSAGIAGLAEKDAGSVLDFIEDPLVTGNSKNYYKGKIVLLVDYRTISWSEFLGMAIQQAPNCITIGEPTAGVVVNVTYFTLPDKTSMRFTGPQASYPDSGEIVYRKGLRIDVPIHQKALEYDAALIYREAFKVLEQ